ncbi:APC family permease [Actinocatenispora rupis]|nr:APC family permease [Actinocatenispora rupis]
MDDQSAVSRSLARNRLGWLLLGGLMLASAAPLTVVGGGVTTGWAVTGLLGIPAAYVLGAALLTLFAVGYTTMASRLPNAGAFYTLQTAGLGRPAGVAAGWVALASYCAMQIGLYGGLGVVGSDAMAQVLGVQVPWYAVAAAGWAVIAICGVLKVDFNGLVLLVLLVVEIAVVLVFDVVQLAHPHAGAVSAAAMNPSTLTSGGASGLVAVVIALTGFVGFEDAPNYAEEAKAGATTKAVFVSLAITAVLYSVSSFAMTVAAGPGNVIAGSTTYGTEFLFHLAGPYVPHILIDVGRLLFVTSLFAAGLAFHGTFNRYAFAMGRDRVLPARLSRTWGRTRSPAYASLTQSTIAALVLIAVAVSGADPQVVLFFDGTVWAGFGVLLLLTACCVAQLRYFARHGGATIWQRVICPSLAGLGLAVVVVVSATSFGTLMGVPDDSLQARLMLAAFAAIIAAAVFWALVRRRLAPDAYDLIGRTGDDVYLAATGRTGTAGRTGTPDPIVLGGEV